MAPSSIDDLPVPSVQIFVDDPSVLFVSTHQSGGYPGTGRISEAGSGDGLGATINIPLPGYSCPSHHLNPTPKLSVVTVVRSRARVINHTEWNQMRQSRE